MITEIYALCAFIEKSVTLIHCSSNYINLAASFLLLRLFPISSLRPLRSFFH